MKQTWKQLLRRAGSVILALVLLMSVAGIVPAAAEGGVTVRLHYHRPDGNYAGWDVWSWETGGNGGTAYQFWQENGEMITDIPVTPGITQVGFIIRIDGGEWTKDVDADQFINLSGVSSGIYDVYVESGVPGYTAARRTGSITVRLHYYRPDGNYDGWDVWSWEVGGKDGAHPLTDEGNGWTVAAIEVGEHISSLGFIVRRNDWSGQEFGDQYINLTNVASGIYDVYVESGVEGYTTVNPVKPDPEPEPEPEPETTEPENLTPVTYTLYLEISGLPSAELFGGTNATLSFDVYEKTAGSEEYKQMAPVSQRFSDLEVEPKEDGSFYLCWRLKGFKEYSYKIGNVTLSGHDKINAEYEESGADGIFGANNLFPVESNAKGGYMRLAGIQYGPPKTYTVIVEYRLWSSDDSTTPVLDTLERDGYRKGDQYDFTNEVPKAFDQNGHHYIGVKSGNEDKLSGSVSAWFSGQKVLKRYYALDDDRDGKPDFYQTTVIYRVQNGAWDDETTGDKVIRYCFGEAKDAEQREWKTAYSAITLEPPAVGTKAAAGYRAGSWDQTPKAQILYSWDKGQTLIYTYTYAEDPNFEPTLKTYTLYLEISGLPSADVFQGTEASFSLNIYEKAPGAGEYTQKDSISKLFSECEVRQKGSNKFWLCVSFDGFEEYEYQIGEFAYANEKTLGDDYRYSSESSYGFRYAVKKDQDTLMGQIFYTVWPTYSITVQYVDWGTNPHYEEIAESVVLTGFHAEDKYDVSAYLKQSIEYNGHHYIYYPDKSSNLTGWIPQPNPIRLCYVIDDNYSGYADMYEVELTYKVVNGKWNDGTTEDIRQIYRITVKNGLSYKNVTADVTPPTVGAAPDKGYLAGAWDIAPPETVTFRDKYQENVFTYTYAEDPDFVPTAGVTLEGWTYGDTPNAPVPVPPVDGAHAGEYTGPVYTYYVADAQGNRLEPLNGAPTDAGSYIVEASWTGEDLPTVTAEAPFTIAQRPVTVTANDVTYTEGETPTLSATVDGLVGSDTVDYTLRIVDGKVVVTGEKDQGNYTVTFIDGTATVNPAPTDPEPTDPEPTDPEPTDPEPTEPKPTEPEPTEPQPTEPEPTEPKPTEPAPTEPEPTEPKPTEPKPTEPKPTEPAPTEPKPTEPAPTEPKPTEPAPTEPAPTEPEPTEPKPTEPVPTEPKPTEPKPTEPVPTEPKPTEPKPTEPVPTEPKPTEPAPTEPAPTEPNTPDVPDTPDTPDEGGDTTIDDNDTPQAPGPDAGDTGNAGNAGAGAGNGAGNGAANAGNAGNDGEENAEIDDNDTPLAGEPNDGADDDDAGETLPVDQPEDGNDGGDDAVIDENDAPLTGTPGGAEIGEEEPPLAENAPVKCGALPLLIIALLILAVVVGFACYQKRRQESEFAKRWDT